MYSNVKMSNMNQHELDLSLADPSYGNFGGMTATTPTLTPTTMKNIAEALQGHEEEFNLKPPGGFLPPPVNVVGMNIMTNNIHDQNHHLLGQENVNNNSFASFLPQSNNINDGHNNDFSNDSDDLNDEEGMEDDYDEDVSLDSESLSAGIYSRGSTDSMSESSRNHSALSNSASKTRVNNNQGKKTSFAKGTKNNSRSKGSPVKSGKSNCRSKGRSNGEKLSPEEERRRDARRERNKQAAARCRKRRMDQTNDLLRQTEILEEEKRKLQKDLEDLQRHCQELEASLSQHECHVKRTGGRNSKSSQMQSTQQINHHSRNNNNGNKPCRPSSLPLAFNTRSSESQLVSNAVSSQTSTESSLLSIQTPSNGIFCLDSLMESTGLTPLLATPSAGGFLPTPVSSSASCGGQTIRTDITPDGPSHKLVSL